MRTDGGDAVLARHESLDECDDAHLLALARAGNSLAADVLWVRSWPSALAVARFVAGDSGDAEDLASEAMAAVFTAIGRGAGPDDVIRAYVATTIRNLHTTALRRRARSGDPVDLEDERVLRLVAEAPDVAESALVGNAFRGLPDRWRQVLWATLVEGRNGDDVAMDLGIKAGAVYALKVRALESLRQRYLTEHALQGHDQECASVHRHLAAIVRGRSRQEADQRIVWQHLRGCEHCAEGYREMAAVNTKLGALLGPAVVGTVLIGAGAGAGSTGLAVLNALRHLSADARYGLTAVVAGAVAVSTLAIGAAVPDSGEVGRAPGRASGVVSPDSVLSGVRSPEVKSPHQAPARRTAASERPAGATTCALGRSLPDAGLPPVRDVLASAVEVGSTLAAAPADGCGPALPHQLRLPAVPVVDLPLDLPKALVARLPESGPVNLPEAVRALVPGVPVTLPVLPIG